MMTDTAIGSPISTAVLRNYFKQLVNNFFKILPMRENNEASLYTYMKSLQAELLGCKDFINVIQDDSNFLTILSILQYLINNPDCSVAEVKREVFRIISICNKLQAKFLSKEVS